MMVKQPGPFSVSTWGGVGDLQLMVDSVNTANGGWKARLECHEQTPGTSHTCYLPGAISSGYYNIRALGLSRGTTLRIDY
jgi:hypothetical protein